MSECDPDDGSWKAQAQSGWAALHNIRKVPTFDAWGRLGLRPRLRGVSGREGA